MPARSKKKEKSIIPVLFTLGVIGWGFFAIDRLTKDETRKESNLIIKDIPNNNRNKSNENSYIKKFFKIVFSDVLEEDKTIKTENSAIEKIHSEQKIDSTKRSEVKITDDSIHEISVKIYYYKLDKNGNPVLVWLQRKVDYDHYITETFKQNISKPADGYNLLDSFPNRPHLIRALKKDDTIDLYFNRKLIEGASLETIRYQLRQLLQTARQFNGINGIKVFVDGENLSDVGVDGLSIPEVITRI